MSQAQDLDQERMELEMTFLNAGLAMTATSIAKEATTKGPVATW